MQTEHTPRLNELFKCGPLIWQKWSKKFKNKSAILEQMFGSYAEMLKLNEQNNQTWMTAPIAGHSNANGLANITLAEGLILAHCNFTHVAQLFGENYFTGAPVLEEDVEYRVDLGQNAQYIKDKCKLLRRSLAAEHRADCQRHLDSFFQIIKTAKWSKIYRDARRANIDNQFPGPPSYFTRRKDGIPVPTLAKFMAGYNKLFKMNIPSKTLENSFLIMNRQTWTNAKRHLATGGQDELPEDYRCLLCGNTENTMHLIFSCEKLSEPCWAILTEGINDHNIREGTLQHNIQLHAFNVM